MTKQTWWEKYSGTPLVVAIIALVSATLSAYITNALTKRTMLETQHLEIKKQAYADFLQAQTLNLEWASKSQEADQEGDPEKKKTLLEQANAKKSESENAFDKAKLRILYSGSAKVVCAMTEYWATSGNYVECTDVGEKERDAAIYRNMRRDFFETLGANEPAEISDRIVVPFLRKCVLPGKPTVAEVCKSL